MLQSELKQAAASELDNPHLLLAFDAYLSTIQYIAGAEMSAFRRFLPLLKLLKYEMGDLPDVRKKYYKNMIERYEAASAQAQDQQQRAQQEINIRRERWYKLTLADRMSLKLTQPNKLGPNSFACESIVTQAERQNAFET